MYNYVYLYFYRLLLPVRDFILIQPFVHWIAASLDTFCLVAPQPQEIEKGSSITLNKCSTRAFQQAINQGSTLPLTSSNGDKVPKFVVFLTISTIKEKSLLQNFIIYKNCQRQSNSAINCLSQGDRPALEAPALHTLRLIARQPWRHWVTSLRPAH